MNRCITIVLLVALGAIPGAGEDATVESPIVSLGLFKNGLAVVTRQVALTAPGDYVVRDVPEPVHGTFWVEGPEGLEVRSTMEDVEVPANEVHSADYEDAWAGKRVRIVFRDPDMPPLSGVVVKDADQDRVWNRNEAVPGNRAGNPWGQYMVLNTDRGRAYLDPSMIAAVIVEDPGAATTVRRPVLTLSAPSASGVLSGVRISYLTHGIGWAPSYRVDLLDPERLRITQSAAIKNELADVSDAEISLISGFPSVQFADVVSPISMKTTWSDFFRQLSQSERPNWGRGAVMMQQAVTSNTFIPQGPVIEAPEAEGTDIHYQSIGKRSLGEGEALSLDIESENAAYERLVEWIIPDRRDEYGNVRTRAESPDTQDVAWDAVRFTNPFSFPMTTAPATFMEKGEFRGQQMSYWVNSGEETIVHITKALSVRTEVDEHEVDDERTTEVVAGHTYQRATVEGTLRIGNRRDVPVSMVIRRAFSGRLVNADEQPEVKLLEEGTRSINPRNELTWNVAVAASSTLEINYQYTVLIYM